MQATTMRKGVPIVVSAPSGGGKTTLCRHLMANLPGVEFSVSHTTRKPRGKERDGIDYHFVSDTQFDQLVVNGALLEWAHVHGCRYGTEKAATEARLAAGIDVLFDIDVQGGRQIAQQLADAVLVFVLPPNMDVLERRLRERGSDSEQEVHRRMQAAKQEILEAAGFYTHWIVNDDFAQALSDLTAVVKAGRLRNVDREKLLAGILGEL